MTPPLLACLRQDGQVVADLDHDTYGNPEVSVETVKQPFRFTGREFDSETGLYYYRARMFDSASRRFLQEDPLHFMAGDHNLYRYVFNSPLHYNDGSGKLAVSTEYGIKTANALKQEAQYAALACGITLALTDAASLISVGGNLSAEVVVTGCVVTRKLKKPCIDIKGQVWAVGEIGYRYRLGSKAHWPHPDGNHTHYLKVDQMPNGDCYWIPLDRGPRKRRMKPTAGPPPPGMREAFPFK